MSDIVKIAANLPPPSLSEALQTVQLQQGQTIEAKITQIIGDNLIRLTSAQGTFELKASNPALQVGANVSVAVAETGEVTLNIPAQAVTPARGDTPAASLPPQAQPAVITTLTGALPAPVPNIYSSTGQPAVPASPAANASPVAPPPVSSELAIAPAVSALAAPALSTTPAAISPAVGIQPVAAEEVAQVGTVSTTANAPLPQAAAPAASTASSLTAVLSDALAKQNSLAPLVANLETVTRLEKPLPAPVGNAIEQVLKVLRPFSVDLSPRTLQQAVKDSGVFFENTLAQAAVLSSVTGEPIVPPPPDLKGALLQLQNALNNAVEKNAPAVRPTVEEPRMFAPKSGEAPQPQAQRTATLPANALLAEIVTTLAHQTESALSRLRVLQFASMPTMIDSPDQALRPVQALHVDLPMFINGQASIIPLQIERDAERRNAEANERRWRVRFAFNLSGLGPIHAMLALGGGLVNVTLWAEKPDTYQLIKSMARELNDALVKEELEVSELDFRTGSPRQALPPAGSMLDTQT